MTRRYGGREANPMTLRGYASALASAVTAAMFVFAGTSAHSAETVSFQGKTLTILIAGGPGGTSDLSGRLFLPYMAKYLPGNPTVIVQDMPGAHGLIALNNFTQRSKPDGTTTMVASDSEIDPINYRVPESHYDPTTFSMVGGINLGGSQMIIRNDALARLTTPGTDPVILGSVVGYPHVGMQIAAWGIRYLGWNARWVTGYSNNSDLPIALERGEIDVTSLADESFYQLTQLLDKSKYTLLYQTGTDAGKLPSVMPQLAGVPLFSKAMEGKISDPIAQQAYDYWQDLSYLFKWMALPPGTPKPIVDAYRTAFKKMVTDPNFAKQSQNITPGFSILPAKELTETIRSAGEVEPAALDLMTKMLREQGMNVESVKKKEKSDTADKMPR
jgi:hypothetical protein